MPANIPVREDRATHTAEPTATTTLLPHHAALIDASAIAPEVAAQRGYRSITDPAELTRLGFAAFQRLVPALLVPGYGVDGRNDRCQLRPDRPRLSGGKAIKYETPLGARMWVDTPPAVHPLIGKPQVPLWITEGIRKADAAASVGLACVSIQGVWNWRGTNEHGGKAALPDWEAIALNDRDVYLAFDSDAMTKAEVQEALARLSRFLMSRGARVHIVRLPAGPTGEKTGLDDYLASGHSVDDLLALVDPEPAVGEVLPLDAYLDALPAGPTQAQPVQDGDELARLRAENERLRARLALLEAKDQRRRPKYAALLRRERLFRRLWRDPELTDGEKVQAAVLADVTAAWAERPSPTGEYHLSLGAIAPNAACSRQTLSKRVKDLERTGAFTLRTERDIRPVLDGATGKPMIDPATQRAVKDFSTRLYMTPVATGTAFLEAVVERRYATEEPAQRKKWGAQPRCAHHPDAGVRVKTVTVLECLACGVELRRRERERTLLPACRSESERQAGTPTGVSRSDDHANYLSERGDDPNETVAGPQLQASSPRSESEWDHVHQVGAHSSESADASSAGLLLEAGAVLGWPRLPLGPGVAVRPGPEAWGKFVRGAPPERVAQAAAAVIALIDERQAHWADSEVAL